MFVCELVKGRGLEMMTFLDEETMVPMGSIYRGGAGLLERMLHANGHNRPCQLLIHRLVGGHFR